MNRVTQLVFVFSSLLLISAVGQAFEVKSNDLKSGGKFTEDFVFQGFGCTGKNLSPEIHWKDAPKDTKSFAITVYDPKAPTGSGWWHWVAVNIPANTTSLVQGWKPTGAAQGVEATNDYGTAGYGGPCPPPGSPHPYTFTLHALKEASIDVPAGATNAVVRFMIEAATIKKASFTAFYGRSK
jgi:Raf kinase inhibitor-like YbhB/YbcL family protein